MDSEQKTLDTVNSMVEQCLMSGIVALDYETMKLSVDTNFYDLGDTLTKIKALQNSLGLLSATLETVGIDCKDCYPVEKDTNELGEVLWLIHGVWIPLSIHNGTPEGATRWKKIPNRADHF